jgi:hypothetical protein
MEFKALREHFRELIGASVDVVDAPTGFAMEVMVVADVGPLVTRVVAGEVERGQPTFIEQGFKIAVNRCYA